DEVFRRLRSSVRGEVRGTAAHDAANLSDLRRDECAVWQRTHTDGQVDVLVEEVEYFVGERHVDVDLREIREELVDHRHDVQTTKDNGSRHHERATRSRVFPRGL